MLLLVWMRHVHPKGFCLFSESFHIVALVPPYMGDTIFCSVVITCPPRLALSTFRRRNCFGSLHQQKGLSRCFAWECILLDYIIYTIRFHFFCSGLWKSCDSKYTCKLSVQKTFTDSRQTFYDTYLLRKFNL